MSECSEIADALWDTQQFGPIRDMDEARRETRRFLPEENPVVTDNVAQRLFNRAEDARIEAMILNRI
ncbi:hypothetical protein [Thioalkalivibrio sp. ALE16]|uniref:hypothetical protein n=1 Tax=Thioalkalivibrio sp. ALE16 TaxID=1158172 RepID=UPI000373B32D|nr:hypothetical protein [Thioalkalivibrio sp. ALE16]